MAISVATYSNGFGQFGGTTFAIDTTGCSLLVANYGGYYETAYAAPTITDNVGNTWTSIRRDSLTGNVALYSYYCSNPITSTGYTFSARTGAVSTYGTVTLMAMKGALTASTPLDKQNGTALSSVTNIQPGAILPSEINEIVISAYVWSITPLATVDSGLTITNNVIGVGGASGHYTSGQAYIVQTATASINPKWTDSSSNSAAATVLSFRYNPSYSPTTPNTSSAWFILL